MVVIIILVEVVLVVAVIVFFVFLIEVFVVRAVFVGQAGCVGGSMADGVPEQGSAFGSGRPEPDVNLCPVWILVKSTF